MSESSDFSNESPSTGRPGRPLSDAFNGSDARRLISLGVTTDREIRKSLLAVANPGLQAAAQSLVMGPRLVEAVSPLACLQPVKPMRPSLPKAALSPLQQVHSNLASLGLTASSASALMPAVGALSQTLLPSMASSLTRPLFKVPPAQFLIPGTQLVKLVSLSAMQPLVKQIRQLLRQWADLADSADDLVRRTARWARARALAVRQAVIQGEEQLVKAFIVEVLGLRPTNDCVEATKDVLLADDWIAQPVGEPSEFVGELKRRVGHGRRAWKPVWETELNGASVALLNQPVRTPDGSLIELGQQVPGPHTTEELALADVIGDKRVVWLQERLTFQEHELVLFKHQERLTWPEAAAMLGWADPDTQAERVRRKIRRLRAEHSRREQLRCR